MWFEALLGIPIGGEMKAATIAASKVNANIMLIDRTQSATRTYFTDRTVEAVLCREGEIDRIQRAMCPCMTTAARCYTVHNCLY